MQKQYKLNKIYQPFIMIEGQKWYYRLNHDDNKKGALMDYYNINDINKGLVVALTREDEKKKEGKMLFSYFKSYIEFGMYQLKFKPEKRCFYEIIFGQLPQKPHFDIDIDLKTEQIDGEEVKDNLIETIISILKDKEINIEVSKDILIFTSHGEFKRSYHVIINNYCHLNNDEARSFYETIVNQMTTDYKKYVDNAVYSPKQQFRIIGSQKLNSGRPKILNDHWTFNDQLINFQYIEHPENDGHKMMLQLELSLITNTNSCLILPSFINHSPKPSICLDTEEITSQLALEAIKLCASIAGITINDHTFPYKLADIKGNIVVLKRIRPSKCRICNRIHENENPYLSISGPEKCVYFYCRRSPDGQKLFLGKLQPKLPTVISTWIQETINSAEMLDLTMQYGLNTTETLLDKLNQSSTCQPASVTTDITYHNTKKLIKQLGKNCKWHQLSSCKSIF